jgi:hypothetical protein
MRTRWLTCRLSPVEACWGLPSRPLLMLTVSARRPCVRAQGPP